MTERDEGDESPMARWLLKEHGPFLPASVTAKVLGVDFRLKLSRVFHRKVSHPYGVAG